MRQVATGTAKSGESAAATRVVDAVDASTVRRSRRLRRRFAVDLTVFRSVVFNYFCVHTMLLYVSYDVPYIYGPARAVARGMAPNAASFLVSVIGISSTIGQVPTIPGCSSRLDIIYFMTYFYAPISLPLCMECYNRP